MKRVAAKFTVVFVVNFLNFDQTKTCMSFAQELLNDVNDDPHLLKWVITGNELWAHDFDVE